METLPGNNGQPLKLILSKGQTTREKRRSKKMKTKLHRDLLACPELGNEATDGGV
jgi:hypothetical protein